MAKKTAKAPVESVPENEGLAQRIRDIEARWGKEFTEVLVDLHDHILGKSPVAPSPPPADDTSGDSGNDQGSSGTAEGTQSGN